MDERPTWADPGEEALGPETGAPEPDTGDPGAAGGDPGPAHEPPGSLPVRVVRVFVSPGRLFAALRVEPRWFAAAVLGAALVALSTVLIPGEIWSEMFRRQMLQAGQELPEGLDLGTIQRILAVVGGSIFWFVWIFVLAGVVTLVLGFILGDDGRYKQYLAVTAHALVIPAIGGLAIVPLRIARRDPQLTLNVGLFAGLEPGYLNNLLTTLDLFLLWSYVVIALGAHEIDRSRSWASAAAILLVLALVLAAGLAFLIPA